MLGTFEGKSLGVFDGEWLSVGNALGNALGISVGISVFGSCVAQTNLLSELHPENSAQSLAS